MVSFGLVIMNKCKLIKTSTFLSGYIVKYSKFSYLFSNINCSFDEIIIIIRTIVMIVIIDFN